MQYMDKRVLKHFLLIQYWNLTVHPVFYLATICGAPNSLDFDSVGALKKSSTICKLPQEKAKTKPLLNIIL